MGWPSREGPNEEAMSCVFCDIPEKKLPAHVVLDDDVLAFLDRTPLFRWSCSSSRARGDAAGLAPDSSARSPARALLAAVVPKALGRWNVRREQQRREPGVATCDRGPADEGDA